MPTLLLVRPKLRQADDIAICTEHGWNVLPFAPIRIVPDADACFRLPETLADCHALFWVSPTAVQLGATQLSGSLKQIIHIAVGSATATELRAHGINAHVSTHGNDSEAALALPVWNRLPHGARIGIVRGKGGREMLPETLRRRGFNVRYAEIYHREPQQLDWTHFQAASPNAAWLTSSEMAIELFAQCPRTMAQSLQSLLYCTHHARIADVLRQLGASNVHIIAQLGAIFTLFPHHGEIK